MADEQEGQKDSSFMFSLKELAGLEEDRVNQEQVARQQEEARRRREREEQERRAREEEAARAEAEQERRRLEEQRRREEEARLEAMRAAEIERQRVEAEQRARLEALQQQQAHAQQLEMIRQDQAKKKLRLAAYGAAGLFVVATVGGIMTYNSLQDEAKAREEQAAKDQQAFLAEKAAQEEKNRQTLAQIAELQDKLQKATNDIEKKKLEDELKKVKQNTIVPQGGPGPKPTATVPGVGGKPDEVCQRGDPTCATLPK